MSIDVSMLTWLIDYQYFDLVMYCRNFFENNYLGMVVLEGCVSHLGAEVVISYGDLCDL